MARAKKAQNKFLGVNLGFEGTLWAAAEEVLDRLRLSSNNWSSKHEPLKRQIK